VVTGGGDLGVEGSGAQRLGWWGSTGSSHNVGDDDDAGDGGR